MLTRSTLGAMSVGRTAAEEAAFQPARRSCANAAALLNRESPFGGPAATAAALIFLFGAKFGGQPERRAFRAAHASVREISGRPLLGAAFLDDVAMHLARAGYDLAAHGILRRGPAKQPARHNETRTGDASRAAARQAAIDGTAKVVP